MDPTEERERAADDPTYEDGSPVDLVPEANPIEADTEKARDEAGSTGT